jgi:hypothetical protein
MVIASEARQDSVRGLVVVLGTVALVVDASVGALVVGELVVGATVVGAMVVGARVVGVRVVGATVVGPAVAPTSGPSVDLMPQATLQAISIVHSETFVFPPSFP